MAVTLKDVALLAGVSPSTVSRTCKDHPSISEETKEKVRRAMAELGYEPGLSTASVTTQNTRSIGIILPPSKKEAYENTFYLETLRGIGSFCNQKQYANILITGSDEEEIFQTIKTMMKTNPVDGFIVLYSKMDDAIINYLYSEGFLYVLIGKANQYANQTIYIDNDNILAGQDATEHLIKMGHKKIGYIGRERSLLFSSDRRSGYQLALASNDLPINPTYCLELSSNYKLHSQEIRTYLEAADRPTAIVVSDDIIAFTLERVCTEMKIAISEDLSIVSFNNSLMARLTSPQLTSVDINSFQLGIEAASQIINHIENPNLLATKIIVPHNLVERDSCKRISVTE